MTKQPEALRLADALETYGPAPWANSAHQAAIELRRLHEEVTEQARLLGISAERELSLLAKIDRLEKQLGEAVWNYGEKVRVNQELLEALKSLVQVVAHLGPCPATLEQACDAIAKAG